MKKEYGMYFREKREEKNLSIEKVSEETRMTTDVIESLENMHKDKFPSDVHLIGFIKLYSNYLGLDANEIVSIMKANKVSETPVDFNMITISNKPKEINKILLIVGFVFAGIVILGGIGFGLWKAMPNIQNAFSATKQTKEVPLEDLRKIEGLNETVIPLREKFLIQKENERAVAQITSITPPVITIDSREYKLEKNKPQIVILPKNKEYFIILRETFLTRNSLLLRFDPQINSTNTNVFQDASSTSLDTSPVKTDGAIINVLSSQNKDDIRVAIELTKGSVFYRFETQDESKEETIRANTVLEFKEYADIYLSRVNAVNIKVNQKEIKLPNNSLPFVFRVRWQEESSGYTLQVIPLP